LGRIVDGGRAIDEAVVHADGRSVEINIHGGSAVAGEVLGLLWRLGAAIAPAADLAEQFPTAHPRWDNPAIGREMLAALGCLKTQLGVAAVTAQWAAGLSELVCGQPTGRQLREAASGWERMRKVLNPPEVVLAGPPNAGKSSLMNVLVGRAVSIVNELPGTTRDWVREPASLGGLVVNLTDTAGLWEAATGVDAEAVARARHRAQEADLVLLLSPGGAGAPPAWLHPRKLLGLASQVDRYPAGGGADVAVSAVTGDGLDELRRRVLEHLGLADFDPQTAMAFTERQAGLLEKAAAAMEGQDHRAVAEAVEELLRGSVSIFDFRLPICD
jgi:tRNA U34 5-carboxymethylaminomethyl modifying GTPase MnmE/TrmE